MVSLKNNKFLILGAGNMGISFIKALLQNKISASKIFLSCALFNFFIITPINEYNYQKFCKSSPEIFVKFLQ